MPFKCLSSVSSRTLPISDRLSLSRFRRRASFATSTIISKDRFSALKERLPNVTFSTNSYELYWHGKGQSYHPSVPPDVVATPETLEDVRTIMQFCVSERIPVIPFGTGTSLEGHVAALYGGLCLDMAKFQSIEIPDFSSADLPDPIAVVGAGVTRKKLNEALRHTGMQFMIDPGADASLGGMVSTGASGTAAVKYGTMRENILALDCVLADEEATVVSTGSRSLKNSAGYDLLSLMCGSEGTLGVITSVTVKLHSIPEYVIAAVCSFSSLYAAAQAVATLKLSNIPVSRCELLDSASVEAFNAYNKESRPLLVRPTLFLEFQGASELVLQEQVSNTQSICVHDFGGSNFSFASNEQDRKALWSARHSLYYAAIALRPGATDALVTDACVPLSKFASLISETAADVREKGVIGPCFGHAGDGNLHCILPILEQESADYLLKVEQVNENLIKRTLDAGGSCSGEHGVGYGKIKYLERQYGQGAVEMMKRIKKGLDPYNLMNPGKVVSV